MSARRIIFVLGTVLSLTACQTPSSTPQSEQSLQTLLGGITVTYKKSGEFDSLTSSASAPVVSELPSAKDEAVTVATLRARRQISEFLNTDISSEKFTETVTSSLQQSSEIVGTQDRTVTTKIATQLRESIKQKSAAILRGSVVESQIYDPQKKTVTVTVSTGTKTTGTSRQLETLMK
jgi:hypothetical protein